MLVNGARVELPAIHATGHLKYGENVRPWDYYLLDHWSLRLDTKWSPENAEFIKGFPLENLAFE